jgi:hypothetical protein
MNAALPNSVHIDSPARMAHHEAGHAVICFVLYGEQVIKAVEVGSPDGFHGKVSYYSRLPIPIACRPPVGAPRRGNPAPVSAEAIVDAHGVLSYAGIAAEGLYGGTETESLMSSEPMLEGATQDRGWVDREALSKLAGTVGTTRPADQFFTEYWHEATRLLRGHWHAVEALAECLQDQPSMNGDRVDLLLRPVCHA